MNRSAAVKKLNVISSSFFVTTILLATLLNVAMTTTALAVGLPDFTELVKKNGAAVVNISTTQKMKHPPVERRRHRKPEQVPPEGPFGDLFQHFFGEGQGGRGIPPDMSEQDSKSLGSGFIISEDGYVLTNYHVIKNANEIIVRLVDRRELKAELIGKDKRSDIALLKIEGKNLPVVDIGDSTKLQVGEWVLAIGSPFGFDHSVTAGIVSAKGRSLPRENYVPFIQTDVAINPGNSGGPLFNLEGQVIGINSQIYSRTGGFMGLSFAIPIDMVMNVVNQLKTSGHVARGWLGVLIQDVTRELAESFNMDKPRGALVAKVLPDSPAEKYGFQVGDVVMEFDGHKILRSSSLPPIVGISPVGKSVDVEILRKGKVKTLEIVLGELPDEGAKVASLHPKALESNRLNITVMDLSAEVRKRLDVKENGVVVNDVATGAARKAGIRRGDVILMINNVDILGTSQFKKLVEDLPTGKSVPLLVQRRGGPVFLALKLSK